MTGAAACLSGIEGVTVVIHGSSGCYYYPTTLLHAPLEGTFIMENEVIFGSAARLREVINGLAGRGRIAVVNTCVPSVLGEDTCEALSSLDILLVDSPGFSGDAEAGYKKALGVLSPRIDPSISGVNIDGICALDPFSRGNAQEIARLLQLAAIPVATVFCLDTLEKIGRPASFTIGTNTDYSSEIGRFIGGTLGIDETARTFRALGEIFDMADVDPVLRECEREEEHVIRACEKYLRRFDPPRTAIFSGLAYATFAKRTLEKYLDADVVCTGSRNDTAGFANVMRVQGMDQAKALIDQLHPDLIVGSSFERSAGPVPGFVGITSPLRGRVRLAPRMIAGIGGTLSFVEDVLNECMNTMKPG